MHKRIAAIAALICAMIVLTPSVAVAQPVQPLPNEGVIAMTKRVCGSSNTWRDQAARNRLTGNMWLYLGKTYDVQCGSVSQVVQPAVQPASSGEWVHPLPGRCATGGYRTSSRPRHNGVDMSAPSGTPIRAVHSGVARHGYQASGAGVYVTVTHGDGTASTYFHMSSRAVANGAWVNAGQVIGYVGSTGNSTGPHLHFETHTGGLWGNRVNPITFMANRGVRVSC